MNVAVIKYEFNLLMVVWNVEGKILHYIPISFGYLVHKILFYDTEQLLKD